MNDFAGLDTICFSHLRWDFVYQRPQHLMTRLSKKKRVFFIEEPQSSEEIFYQVSKRGDNLWVIVPHLPASMDEPARIDHPKEFISRFLEDMKVRQYAAWYYTPMALPISDHLHPLVTIYDCMDELSAFKFAPPTLTQLESQLIQQADIVFTGGYSLYEAKRAQHPNIHPFPSSIDYDHFLQARILRSDPEDQKNIRRPRFGFYGVIDERMDLQMVAEIAAKKKDWHFILIGPVVKINESDLPRPDNIHYLGKKDYDELPLYLSGWDIAIMPFALNESTRFISPTKTPEYLAGGKPVISTPILDVVRQYGDVVHFANSADDFIKVAESEIDNDAEWLEHVDKKLSENSWDKTWSEMEALIADTLGKARIINNIKDPKQYV